MVKKTLIISILILILGIGFLPQILSSHVGKGAIEGYLSQKFNGKVSIEQVSLSWWGPQEFKSIRWKKKDTQIYLDKMLSEDSFFTLLKKQVHFTIQSSEIAIGKNNPLNQLLSIKGIQKKELKLLISPVTFSHTRGKIVLQKTTLLVNHSLPFFLWGSMDFLNDQLDMTFALGAQSFKKVFGIEGLPENYQFEIPLKGTLLKPDFDLSKAIGKVTALLIWQKLSKEKEIVIDTT